MIWSQQQDRAQPIYHTSPLSEKRRSKKEKKTVYRVEMETESEEIIGKEALNRLESHRYYNIIATPGHPYSPSPSALHH